jgi:hypothetical protein
VFAFFARKLPASRDVYLAAGLEQALETTLVAGRGIDSRQRVVAHVIGCPCRR